jgi:phage head maturation protease
MSIIKKVFKGQIKKVDPSSGLVEAVVSDETVDRYDEVVLASAWEKHLKTYMKHPVLLSSHDYFSVIKQIGKAERVYIKDGALHADLRYFIGEGNTEADWAFKLAQKGIAAYSVGFLSKASTTDSDEIGKLVEGKRKPYRVYKEVELLEISHVTVPANPSALQKSIESVDEEDFVLRDIYEETLKLFSTGELASNTDDTDTEVKTIVPYKEYPTIDENKSWDATEAVKRVRKWASSDGSGDKDKVDFSKYKEAFLKYDPENKENFGSYSYPHHDVENGELKTHWRGTVAAMVRLSNIKDEAEREKAYNHLAKHYKQFDKEPPDFKTYVSVEDVEAGCKDLVTATEMTKTIYEAKQVELLNSLVRECLLSASVKEAIEQAKLDFKAILETVLKDNIGEIVEELSLLVCSAQETSKNKEDNLPETYVRELLDLNDSLKSSV